MNNSILLVEDDAELAAMIGGFLADQGFLVSLAGSGPQAVAHIASNAPDLTLLDVMLPGFDGVEVVRRVRPDYTGIIIMLTARGDELTEIQSLDRGADAFLEKPVRPHILLAHIRANLRRQSPASDERGEKQIRLHDLLILPGRREVFLNDKLLEITSMEYELLCFFVERTGEVVTREELYRTFRRIEYDGIDRSMDMRISALRRKMNDEHPPYQYIKTVRGKGYLLAQ